MCSAEFHLCAEEVASRSVRLHNSIQHNDVKMLFQCRLKTRPTQRCHSYDSAAKNDVIETDRAVSVSRSLGEGGAIIKYSGTFLVYF